MSIAVKRSLKILERVALAKCPQSFSQLDKAVGGISHASLTRLLNELISEGFLFKNETGGYECGHRLGIFAAVSSKKNREIMIDKFSPMLKEISNKYDITGILMENVAGTPTTIYKAQTEASVNMADIGSAHPRSSDLWMEITVAYTPRLRKEFPEYTEEQINLIKDQGYCFEYCKIRPHFTRLGFPLLDDNHDNLIGILGFGGTALHMNYENLNDIIRESRKVL